MSVRAYRINKIEREDESTFNLFHHDALYDFLLERPDVWRTDSEDGLRQFEVSVERLEEAVKELKAGKLDDTYDDPKRTIEEREYLIANLEKDIAWANKKGDEYIMYDCY